MSKKSAKGKRASPKKTRTPKVKQSENLVSNTIVDISLIEDNEQSTHVVQQHGNLFWVKSDIFIIRNNQPLPYKSVASFGPFETKEKAIESIIGITKISDLNV